GGLPRDDCLRLTYPALINELIFVALPQIGRNGVELLAGDAWNSRSQRARSVLTNFGSVCRFDVDALPHGPLPDMSLGHFGDFRFGPIRKMQLALKPQRRGPRDKVGTMSGAGLEAELEYVLFAAMPGDGPFPQVLEKAPRPERFAGD